MKSKHKEYIDLQAQVVYLKKALELVQIKASKARREFFRDYPKGAEEDKYYQALRKELEKQEQKAIKDFE